MAFEPEANGKIRLLNPLRQLEFRSNIEPHGLALCDISNSLSYSQLFSLVKKVARKLELTGIRTGDLVITCLPSTLDWVFTNALFHEACVTCSNHSYNPIDPYLQADWVISDQPVPDVPASRLVLVDTAWIRLAKEQEASNATKSYASHDDLCRLMLTSGTTGGSKAVPYSLRMLDNRLATISSYWSASGREMNLMSLATVGGFLTALNSVSIGEAHYFAPAGRRVKFVNQHQIKSLIGSPIQLAAFMKEVDESNDDIPRLEQIRSAGGGLPDALFRQLRRLFHAKVYNIYGSTEVGGVCTDLVKQQRDQSHAGYMLPTAEVEIVSEEDERQPLGVEGILRTKTSSMATGYYKNPEATSKSFKDGWFYPGDRGRLGNDGSLALTGRDSEIINRGGTKIDPVTIDTYLMSYTGVDDAAAFGLTDNIGLEKVAAAFVAGDEFDARRLQSDLLTKFGPTSAPSVLFKVKQIPRNEMGKVKRLQLSQEFVSAMAKRAQRQG